MHVVQSWIDTLSIPQNDVSWHAREDYDCQCKRHQACLAFETGKFGCLCLEGYVHFAQAHTHPTHISHIFQSQCRLGQSGQWSAICRRSKAFRSRSESGLNVSGTINLTDPMLLHISIQRYLGFPASVCLLCFILSLSHHGRFNVAKCNYTVRFETNTSVVSITSQSKKALDRSLQGESISSCISVWS